MIDAVHPNENKAVQFEEDGQQFMMEVQAPSDSDTFSSQSDDDEDDDEHEVSFKDSSNNHTSDSDEELDYSEDELDNTTTETEARNQHEIRQRKIKKIDKEMKKKLQELQSLMYEGGMTESVKEIEKTLDVVQRSAGKTRKRSVGDKPSETQNQNSTVHRRIDKQMTRFSGTVNLSKPCNSPSEDTIYEKANPEKRRFSSSSDDDIINSSDEMLAVQIDSLNVYPTPILDNREQKERRQSQDKDFEHDRPSTSQRRYRLPQPPSPKHLTPGGKGCKVH